VAEGGFETGCELEGGAAGVVPGADAGVVPGMLDGCIGVVAGSAGVCTGAGFGAGFE